MTQHHSQEPKQNRWSGLPDSWPGLTLPARTFNECSSSLVSSFDLLQSSHLGRLLFQRSSGSGSLSELKNRAAGVIEESGKVIEAISKESPDLKWKRSIWSRQDLPADLNTPAQMIDGGLVEHRYFSITTDVRELLLKVHTVRSILTHLNRMIDAIEADRPPLDEVHIVHGMGTGIGENYRRKLSKFVSSFIGAESLPFDRLVAEDRYTKQLEGLKWSVAWLADINGAVAHKITEQVLTGIQLWKCFKPTAHELASGSPGLVLWERHPWTPYLNDIRVQLCAAQYLWMYQFGFHEEAIGIPRMLLMSLGAGFDPSNWFEHNRHARLFRQYVEQRGQTFDPVVWFGDPGDLRELNQVYMDTASLSAGWDELPGAFLRSPSELSRAMSEFGFRTESEDGYTPLKARVKVSAGNLYQGTGREIWYRISSNPGYCERLNGLRKQQAAAVIKQAAGAAPLHITVLGVGNSSLEPDLLRTLIDTGAKVKGICVHEFSSDDARKAAKDIGKWLDFPEVSSISGDFAEISLGQLTHLSERRIAELLGGTALAWKVASGLPEKINEKRLLALLGGTMGNLDLAGTMKLFSAKLRSGDLFLFDCGRPTENDALLQDNSAQPIQGEWMSAALKQAFPQIDQLGMNLEVRKTRLEDGYQLNFVMYEPLGCYEFDMIHVARHSSAYVGKVAAEYGMGVVQRWDYSESLSAYLFAKM